MWALSTRTRGPEGSTRVASVPDRSSSANASANGIGTSRYPRSAIRRRIIGVGSEETVITASGGMAPGLTSRSCSWLSVRSS